MNQEAFHVIVCAQGKNRGEAAAKLREVADRLEAGEYPSPTWPAKAIAPATDFSGELPFTGRWFGVCYDSEDLDPPWALFARREQAEQFRHLIEAGELDGDCWSGADAGIVRCDLAGSLWNCIDDDAHVTDAEFGGEEA